VRTTRQLWGDQRLPGSPRLSTQGSEFGSPNRSMGGTGNLLHRTFRDLQDARLISRPPPSNLLSFFQPWGWGRAMGGDGQGEGVRVLERESSSPRTLGLRGPRHPRHCAPRTARPCGLRLGTVGYARARTGSDFGSSSTVPASPRACTSQPHVHTSLSPPGSPTP
jgi:hypothetical protein